MTERRTRSAANSPPGTPTLRHSTHSSAIHFPTLGLLKSLSSAAHTNVPMSNAELLEEAASRKKGHEDVERRKRYLVNGLLGHHSQSATHGTQESPDGSARGRDRPRTQRRSASLSGLVRKRRTTDDHTLPSSPLAHETFTSAPRSLHTTSALASANDDQAASAPRRPAALDARAATVTAAELSKLRASQPDVETGSSSPQTATSGPPRSAGLSVAAIASDLSAGVRTPTTKPVPDPEPASATGSSPQLSARHRQILDSSTELFCSRPTNEIFDRDWRDDAVFEDPLAYCKGRHEWAAQWFGMVSMSKNTGCGVWLIFMLVAAQGIPAISPARMPHRLCDGRPRPTWPTTIRADARIHDRRRGRQEDHEVARRDRLGCRRKDCAFPRSVGWQAVREAIRQVLCEAVERKGYAVGHLGAEEELVEVGKGWRHCVKILRAASQTSGLTGGNLQR